MITYISVFRPIRKYEYDGVFHIVSKYVEIHCPNTGTNPGGGQIGKKAWLSTITFWEKVSSTAGSSRLYSL